jgi:hypothetical protein
MNQKRTPMFENNTAAAAAYYHAMNDKNLLTIETFLHPEVRLIGPMAEIKGKAAVLVSIKNFFNLFETLTVRAQCGEGVHVMLAYDLQCPAPIGLVRGAVLLTFQGGQIIRYELFYDARPFVKKRDEIFASS